MIKWVFIVVGVLFLLAIIKVLASGTIQVQKKDDWEDFSEGDD